jgi:archaellum component FlaC
MNNKYNLDYYETMDVANEYLDRIEDEFNMVLNKYKGDSEKLEEALNKVKNNFEPIIHSEDMLYLYLD